MLDEIIQISFGSVDSRYEKPEEHTDHCYKIEYEGQNLLEAITKAQEKGFKSYRFQQTFNNGSNGHLNLKYEERNIFARITSNIKPLAGNPRRVVYLLYIPVKCQHHQLSRI